MARSYLSLLRLHDPISGRVAAPLTHASTASERRPSSDGRRPSWTPPLTAGTYSRHPAWTDRTRWLAQVDATVRHSSG